MIPVILSGGSGTRLWPLSRTHYPKQFIQLLDQEDTLFQATLKRINNDSFQPPIIVGSTDHRFLILEQLKATQIKTQHIILEPFVRNTAPAIALAALKILQQGDDLMLVMPADHHLYPTNTFHQDIIAGKQAAEANLMVTFGIAPTSPETGYGYIKTQTTTTNSYSKVTQFIEKPSLSKAETFMREQCYHWNSGIFLFKASVYIQELERLCPEILTYCRQSLPKTCDHFGFLAIDPNTFHLCPSESIDYVIMEHTDLAVMQPLASQWRDLGSWQAIWETESEKQAHKNSTGNIFDGDIAALDSNNCFVKSPQRLTTLIGVKDLIVIQSEDALLIAHKDQSQQVKALVQKLKQAQRPETEFHRQVHRPWGWYDAIDNGDRFQVKRIMVNPGASLSLQMHHHRAEHWVVVRGTAKITRGEKELLVSENESTFIPIGTKHRLSNPGKIPLELIEIQSGSYLGEDDIIRFEDDYQRHADKN